MAIRILLIDDEEAFLEIAKIFLEREQGFEVDTALSAQEALDRLKRDRFDVIVSDYHMPGMNGIELLKKLKSAGDTTPYILFTGRGREDVAIDALNNGASFYLQKGGDPKSQFAELVNVIETSVRQARAEKTLREEKDRTQQYINLAGVMLLALDKHGNVTLINKKGCEILGYEEDQILGKSWFESFLPENRRDEVKAIFKGLMRGELGPLEHQPPFSVLCKGGVERRIAFTNALLKDEKGEIVGTLSSGEDVTEREQMEGILRKSEEKYRRFVEIAQEGIWAIDANANTTYVNPQMAEMLGYTPEEMIGRTIFSFTDERGKEVAQMGLSRQEQGTREQHDFEFLRKDGQRVYASMQTSLMMDEAGSPTGAMAVVADITERKRTEDALRESEKRYRLLVESAAEAIIVAQDGMLRLVNPMTVAMIGLSEQELMSKPFPAFVHPDDRAMVVDSYQRRLRGEAVPARYAFRLLAKDGITKWVEISAAAIDWEGRPATLNFLTDITERKKAEEELASAQMRLKETHHLGHIGTWDWLIENDVVTWSEELYDIVGRDSSLPAPTYAEHSRHYTPTSWEMLSRNVKGALTTGEPYNLELELVRADGSILWVTAIGSVKRDGGGKVIGLHGLVQDITERKRAEEALKKSEAKFAIAFNSSPEMMVIGSLKEGRLVDVNSAFLQRTGHSREAVLGRTVTEIGMIGEAERDRLRSVVEEKGSVQGLEIHDRTKSGAERITLVSAAALSIEDEPCMLVIISDITDRKRAEEALRASETRFLSFMSHIPAIAFMSDASDRYLYINKAYEVAFDVKESDIVGKTVEEVWPAATAAAYRKSDQQVLASDEGIELVEIIPHKGGPREFLTFKFPVPDARGTSKVLGGVSIDITEQRRVEKALRQANKKLNLLGSVTRHDVINQLSVLFAWLEIAKEVARDESVHEHLARVVEAAKIIQRQLEFTAEYQEVGVKHPEWIDLADAVNIGVEGLDKGKVSLNIDLAGIQVFADSMLEKVFHNLVENALRHGEKVKSISISAREMKEGLTIVCEDDGIGIPADDKEKVFLRGFGKNTGFGLYMVREVLDITGIRVGETGVPGKGARFEIVVPAGSYRIGHPSQ